ncbi:MAG: response regulator [Deltaproteobacteria bacterium]|nr:response regulator [Deltaproteobacteria bacterium]
MTPQRILLVDDDSLQLKLGAIRLREAGFTVETAGGGEEALRKVRDQVPDAIMSDVLMDDLDGFGLCRALRADPSMAGVPIILLSAHYLENPDQSLAKSLGACALVSRTPDFGAELTALRANLGGEPTHVTGAPGVQLYEEHLRTAARQITRLLGRARVAEDQFRALFESAHDTMTVLTPDGIILEANERWRELTGSDPLTMIGRHVSEFAAAGRGVDNTKSFAHAVQTGSGRAAAVPIATRFGTTLYMDFSVSVTMVDGSQRVLAIGRDSTDQVIAAQKLAAAEHRYRTLVERIPDVIWTSDADGIISFVTPNCERVLGLTPEEMMRQSFEERTAAIHPADRQSIRDAYRAYAAGGTPYDIEYRRRHTNGNWLWLRVRAIGRYERNGQLWIEGIISDITERKRLEDTLRQSQKMESLGKLTGGIAHDFNNILAVILSNSQFLCEDLDKDDPRRKDAAEIGDAAERAAKLTRQLLAFSRHQVLEPRVVVLDAVLSNIETMLGRLIGENIEFAVVRGAGVGNVRVDVGQLEQVLVNLVVNARDAMPGGGRLTIETSTVVLDDERRKREQGVPPGTYTMLSVTDTGCGMDAETRSRVFEPFFTTKELGRGTGLGLSTCYGIVAQSGGHIGVTSELGQGTTFEILLPRVDEAPFTVSPPRPARGGNETILVLEDDEQVRSAICRMLAPHGYRVLECTHSAEALEVASTHHGTIHLVLSDVVMPGMSGPEVVSQLRGLGVQRTLYMSGYTDHELTRTRVLEGMANFIEKPFTGEALARQVRATLDA